MTTPRAPLFLFDLDGTLVHADGAGRRAMARAFTETLGAAHGLDGLGFGGRTDRAIIRMAAAGQGVALDEAGIDRVLASYLTIMAEVCGEPGVFTPIEPARETARALFARFPGHLGLGTGNAAPVAALKVEGIGLDGLFAFGGYGDDAEDRAAMLKVGLERGLACLDRAASGVLPIVIGDTVADVDAARRLGLRVIAVATGTQDMQTLERASPDLTLSSLALERVLRALDAWA